MNTKIFDHEEAEAIRSLNGEPIDGLIALLRSDRPIHSEVRALLADVLDPKGTSRFRLVMKHRQRGNPADGWMKAAEMYGIGSAVAEAFELNGKFESAVAEICQRYRIGRSKATAGYSLWRDVTARLAAESKEIDE